MASRFWVGGNGNWDGTAGTKWATTSGGAGGASVPTASDDVYLDAASGAVTVTINTGGGDCLNFDATGFTGTLQNGTGTFSVYGNATLASGMSVTSLQIGMRATTTGHTFTSNGATPLGVTFGGTGGGWSLADNLTTIGNIVINAGTFDSASYNITTQNFTFIGVLGTFAYLRTSTITATRATNVGLVQCLLLPIVPGAAGIDWGTSTLKVDCDSNVGPASIIVLGGPAFYNVELTGAGTGGHQLTASSQTQTVRMNTLTMPTSPRTFSVDPLITLDVKALDVDGTAGNLNTLKSTTNGTPWTLTTGAGYISCDYLSIRDCHASENRFFAGANSTSVSGNTGWVFSAPPTGGGQGLIGFFPNE